MTGARWRCGARGAGAWRVVLVLGARRAWPRAAGGRRAGSVPAPGTRCWLRDRCPRGPRDARAAGAGPATARRGPGRGARDDGCADTLWLSRIGMPVGMPDADRGCGSDRTGCVSQLSPALALESTQFLYSTPANSSPEKARARSQECTSKRSRTCHPGYAVWCGKCAELRRRSAPLGEPATHMPARHAAP